jgi:glucokinase
MAKAVVCFDVGGTDIKAGVVSQAGEIITQKKIPTGSERPGKEIITDMANAAQALRDEARGSEIIGVGVGSPGLVGEDTVLLGGCENIPHLNGMRFGDIGDALGLPTKGDNDATVAALGEVSYGAGTGAKAALVITLGTGVGGGIVINGKAYRGATGYAGEFGHTSIDPDGLACNCGSYGCIEQYASANALVRRAKQKLIHALDTSLTPKALEDDKAKAVFDAARAGDALAAEIIEETGMYLGMALSSAANLLNLDVVIVGGGMSKGFDLLKPAIERSLNNYTLKLERKILALKPAKLGNDAGILGCAALFFSEEE